MLKYWISETRVEMLGRDLIRLAHMGSRKTTACVIRFLQITERVDALGFGIRIKCFVVVDSVDMLAQGSFHVLPSQASK